MGLGTVTSSEESRQHQSADNCRDNLFPEPDMQEVVNRVAPRTLSTKQVGNIIAYFQETAQEH
jgi:hypothetical protein